MSRKLYQPVLTLLFATAMLSLHAEPVRVTHSQGTEHGYLTIHSESGEFLGHGDLIQIAHGSRVTTEISLHFKDGSIDDETATYTQAGTFRLLKDHHIQKGPFFPKPLDLLVESNGHITTRSTDKDGSAKVETQQLEIPPDISNGILSALITNIAPNTAGLTAGMVAPVGKGRLVKLNITSANPEKFNITGITYTARVFRVHIDLGGIVGAVAPIVGKQPGDLFIWVSETPAPQLIRLLGPLAEGGKVVSVEISGTSFEHSAAHK